MLKYSLDPEMIKPNQIAIGKGTLNPFFKKRYSSNWRLFKHERPTNSFRNSGLWQNENDKFNIVEETRTTTIE